MLLLFFVVSPGGHPELLTKVHPACRRADGLPVTPPHDKAPAAVGVGGHVVMSFFVFDSMLLY